MFEETFGVTGERAGVVNAAARLQVQNNLIDLGDSFVFAGNRTIAEIFESAFDIGDSEADPDAAVIFSPVRTAAVWIEIGVEVSEDAFYPVDGV